MPVLKHIVMWNILGDSAEVEVVRLLWFVENFFTYGGKQFHEIALYFLMRFLPASAHLLDTDSFQGHEEAITLTYQWFPRRVEVLAELPLLPAFLQTALQNLPESTKHVVEDDGAID